MSVLRVLANEEQASRQARPGLVRAQAARARNCSRKRPSCWWTLLGPAASPYRESHDVPDGFSALPDGAHGCVADVLQLAQGVDLRRLERSAAHASSPKRSSSSEGRQRGLRPDRRAAACSADTVNSLLDKRYDANTRLEADRFGARVEPRDVAAVRRARTARAHLRRAVRRRRHGRRPNWRSSWSRSAVRSCSSRSSRPSCSVGRWSRPPERRAAGRDPAEGGRRRVAARVRLHRAGFAVVADRSVDDGEPRRATRGRCPARRSRCSAATARISSSSRRRRPTAVGLFLVAAVGRHAWRRMRCRTACAARTSCCRGAPAQLLGSRDRRARRHRVGHRHGHRSAVRGGGRCDEPDAVDDRRVPQDARAVRPADRGVPGAAVPRRRHVRLARTGPLDGAARPARAGR